MSEEKPRRIGATGKKTMMGALDTLLGSTKTVPIANPTPVEDLGLNAPETSEQVNPVAGEEYEVETFFKRNPRGSFTVGKVYDVPLCLIDENPSNARRFFRKEDLVDLSESLKEEQEQIPQAFRRGDRFVLVDGARRLKALKLLTNKSSMRICLTDPVSDPMALYFRSRTANLSEPLTIYDDALGFVELLSQDGMTQDILAKQLGDTGERRYSQPLISRLLKLAELPANLFELMAAKEHLQKEIVATTLAVCLIEAIKAGCKPEALEELVLEINKEQTPSNGINKHCEEWLSKRGTSLNLVKTPSKNKPHGETSKVTFGPSSGAIKYFENKKEFNLNLKNINREQYDLLRTKLSDFLKEMGGDSND